MTRRTPLLAAFALGLALVVPVGAELAPPARPAPPGTAQAPMTAQDILARSVAAHGGDRLSSWRTMSITGTIEMQDGITYRAAYRVLAKLPDKLKVEQDMTVDRGGRYVYEYFRNGSQAWSRRNLIPGKADPARLDRWMNQCYGVSYYAKPATALALKADATADWMAKAASGYQVTDRRPAYVVTATTPAGAVDLYIDKGTFYLLQENAPDLQRLYSAFRDFGGTVHATRILEITRGRGGDVITPITYEAVRYGEAIEDWIFEEDMPKKNPGTGLIAVSDGVVVATSAAVVRPSSLR